MSELRGVCNGEDDDGGDLAVGESSRRKNFIGEDEVDDGSPEFIFKCVQVIKLLNTTSFSNLNVLTKTFYKCYALFHKMSNQLFTRFLMKCLTFECSMN